MRSRRRRKRIRSWLLVPVVILVLCVVCYKAGICVPGLSGVLLGTGHKTTDGYTVIACTRNEEALTQILYPVLADDEGHLYATAQTLEILFDCTAYPLNPDLLYGMRGEDSCSLTPVLERHALSYYDVLEAGKALGDVCRYEKRKRRLDITGDTSVLPASYDYRQEGRASSVRDQKDTGTCWAAATATALECSLLPGESVRFAPDHINLHNAFYNEPDAGGNSAMASAYLTAWQGPVLEADDPYGDGMSPDGLSAVRHVQEVHIYSGCEREALKQAIWRYGAVESDFYMDLENKWCASAYYDAQTASYCYTGTEASNHDLVMIGWDDTYPAENFTVSVPGDGAWICQNSWGKEFGDAGIFYVSYYDTNLGTRAVCYTQIDPPGVYDHLYQSDLCGWVGHLGYDRDEAWFANVYTAAGNESIAAVGFYATGEDTQYQVYSADAELMKRHLLAEGTLMDAGFYTIPVIKEPVLAPGERFSVIVKICTPGHGQPVACEFAGVPGGEMADLSDGEGYISVNGIQWTGTEAEKNCNVCLKVYTRDAGE